MGKLYKKEEESLLNKKKKREEIKQKNKVEKSKANKNLNAINQYNNYMGLYMNQMPPMNNQPQGYLDGYQNIYYYNNINSSYQFPTQMIGYNPYFHQYTFMEQPKTLEEHIEIIAQRGIVNNIIGAFFIKEHQEKEKNNEKRKVPVAMVEFDDDQDNNNSNANDGNNKVNNSNNDEKNKENDNEKKMENEKEDEKHNNSENKPNEEKNELKKPEFVD